MAITRWLKTAGWIFILLWYGFFLARKTDLTTQDIGRHLKNGEQVFAAGSAVLKTNFYSYTHPEFSVINHHWGSGLIFYGIERVAGFSGLALFF